MKVKHKSSDTNYELPINDKTYANNGEVKEKT